MEFRYPAQLDGDSFASLYQVEGTSKAGGATLSMAFAKAWNSLKHSFPQNKGEKARLQTALPTTCLKTACVAKCYDTKWRDAIFLAQGGDSEQSAKNSIPKSLGRRLAKRDFEVTGSSCAKTSPLQPTDA